MIISTRGLHFTIDGIDVSAAGVSDFSLFYKFIKGVDIIPILNNRTKLYEETKDAPLLRYHRVFSQAKNIFQMRPGDYPYTSVTAFTDFVYEQCGRAIKWEAMIDCEDSHASQTTHWSKMQDALHACKHGNYILSLGNEYPQNGYDPLRFTSADGIICSSGSNLGDELPPSNFWDFCEWHGRRDHKAFHSSGDLSSIIHGFSENGIDWPGTNRPTIHDEPIGFAEQRIPGRRSANPQVAYNLAFNSVTCGSGGCYHFELGLTSDIIPDGSVQEACGLASMMGFAKADPVQTWNGLI